MACRYAAGTAPAGAYAPMRGRGAVGYAASAASSANCEVRAHRAADSASRAGLAMESHAHGADRAQQQQRPRGQPRVTVGIRLPFSGTAARTRAIGQGAPRARNWPLATRAQQHPQRRARNVERACGPLRFATRARGYVIRAPVGAPLFPSRRNRRERQRDRAPV